MAAEKSHHRPDTGRKDEKYGCDEQPFLRSSAGKFEFLFLNLLLLDGILILSLHLPDTLVALLVEEAVANAQKFAHVTISLLVVTYRCKGGSETVKGMHMVACRTQVQGNLPGAFELAVG